MLEIKNVGKSFNTNDVLKDISMKVEKGEVVAIIGPSGSGKTTLLRCISFLEKADRGSISFAGVTTELSKAKSSDIKAIRRNMGFVFQSFNLFRNKTALQNVMEGLTVARKIPKNEARETALAQLTRVGLGDRVDFYPDELSGGQQQRVAIARALALSPEVILFDEPTSALDPELTQEVLECMRGLAHSGTTMIVVTHEMDFARDAADRVIFMEGGVVVEDSPSHEFFEHPKSERSAQYIKNFDHRGYHGKE